jgi:hypothetical protein
MTQADSIEHRPNGLGRGGTAVNDLGAGIDVGGGTEPQPSERSSMASPRK